MSMSQGDLVRYYQESIPPALTLPPSTGATAGIPGTWTPANTKPPASLTALVAGTPKVVVASPATAWTSGQFVQTRTAGAAGRATWTGTAWVGGAAPLDEGEEPLPPPEPEPEAPPEPEPGPTGGGGGYSKKARRS